MAAAARAQNFGAVIFERNGAADGRNFVAHDVGGAQSRESFANGYLSHAFLRGIQEEESNENAPQARHNDAFENSKSAEKDHGVGDDSAAGASDARGFGKVLARSPDDGAEDSAAVERETGEKIEDSEQEIGGPEPRGKRIHHLIGRKRLSHSEEESGEKAASDRTSDGDVEFLDGFRRVALDAGDSAEYKQSDRENANLVMLRDDAVGEFVEEERAEKENAGEDADAQMLGGSPGRILLRELRVEKIGDAGKNNDPRGVEIDGYPQDFASRIPERCAISKFAC